jgi:hypothetical protein
MFIEKGDILPTSGISFAASSANQANPDKVFHAQSP